MGRGVPPPPCRKETLPAWEEKQATVGNIPVLTYACKGGADPQEGDLRGLAQGGREHAGWQGSPSPWSYLYLHGHHAPGRSLVAGGPGAGFPPSPLRAIPAPHPPSSHSLSTSFPGPLLPDCSWPVSAPT